MWAAALVVVVAMGAVVGCGGTSSPADAARTMVTTPASMPSVAAVAEAASPGALPDGTLPSLAGVLPGVGVAVPPGGVLDWVPPAARLRDDARTTAPWIARLEGDAMARWSPAPALEVQGVVLDGAIALTDRAATNGAAATRVLRRWGAFRAPGAAIAIAAAEGAPARIVLFAATRDGSPVGRILRDPESGPAPRRLPGAAARPMPLEVADLHDRAALRWAGGRLEARIAWDGKDQAAALDVILFAPDAAVGEHTHPGAWECLLPLRAAGDVILDGAARAVRPGVTTCFPPDVAHAWKPAGTEPLIAIQVYAPAGAEQRFRDLAARSP